MRKHDKNQNTKSTLTLQEFEAQKRRHTIRALVLFVEKIPKALKNVKRTLLKNSRSNYRSMILKKLLRILWHRCFLTHLPLNLSLLPPEVAEVVEEVEVEVDEADV